MNYRGYVIHQEKFGHWNVSINDQFCGGFKTRADAEQWIDNRFYRVERIPRPGKTDAYRVTMIEKKERGTV